MLQKLSNNCQYLTSGSAAIDARELIGVLLHLYMRNIPSISERQPTLSSGRALNMNFKTRASMH